MVAYSATVLRDPSPESAARRKRLATTVGAAITLALAPAVVFFVYGVEAFYQLSGADPFIYTGYTFSFTDLIERWGYPYYAVRFGLIVPSNVFAELFGPATGYLVLRWVLVVATSASLFIAISRRFSASTGALAVSMLLLSPTFIRAVMTQYSTTVGVPAVAAAFALMLIPSERWRLAAWRTAAGIAIGAAVNSNVFSVLPIAGLVAVWVWVRRRERREVARELAWIAAGALAVTAVGYLVYAVRFGDGNLLAPSLNAVDRLSSGQSPDNEAGLTWLNFRPEVWLAPIASIVCGIVIRVSSRPSEWWTRAVAAAPLAAWSGYAIHTFVLGSNTLEIYFYSSYMIGPIVMALAVSLGLLVERWGRLGAPILLAATAMIAIAPMAWTHLGRGLRLWSLNGLLPVVVLIVAMLLASRTVRWTSLTVLPLVGVLPLVTTLCSPQNVPNPPGARPRQEPTYPMSIFRYDDRSLDLYTLAAEFAASVPRTARDPGSVVFWRPASDYTAILMQWTYLGPYSTIPDADEPYPALAPAAIHLLQERTPRFLVIVSSQEGAVETGVSTISTLDLDIIGRQDMALVRGPYRLWVARLEMVPDSCDSDGQGETVFWSELPTCGD